MQTWNYWKQFENTGKVEDYLFYKANSSQLSERMAGCKSAYGEKTGNDNAGINTGSGDCTETVTCG